MENEPSVFSIILELVSMLGGMLTLGYQLHAYFDKSFSKPVDLSSEQAIANYSKSLTLNLVKNAKWSDGKPLTSADVAYSLTSNRVFAGVASWGVAAPRSPIEARSRISGMLSAYVRLTMSATSPALAIALPSSTSDRTLNRR